MAIAATLVSTAVWGALAPPGVGAATQSAPTDGYDRLLDLYVRDGLVYYAAVQQGRAPLDRYLSSLAEEPPGFSAWPDDDRAAFWLNAYNALVLRAVVDHYPIRGASPNYPANSIRQLPGVFDERIHPVAGRRVTLDQIEETVLPAFGDPRLFLALGRGAVGSGRLRSEVYVGVRLDGQLTSVVEEVAATPRHFVVDRLADTVHVSAIFGWREAEFVAAYADRGSAGSGRAPIERAIIALIGPALFPSERAYLAEGTFSLGYQDFDWRLNDLTGGWP